MNSYLKKLEETNKKLHKRLWELEDNNQTLFNKITAISLKDDIEQKLTDFLSYEIAKEIDDQIKNSMLAGANIAGAVQMAKAAGLDEPQFPPLKRKLRVKW